MVVHEISEACIAKPQYLGLNKVIVVHSGIEFHIPEHCLVPSKEDSPPPGST